MKLAMLFEGLCDLLSKDSTIEKNAIAELRRAKTEISPPQDPTSLPTPFLEVMKRDSAHPVCHLISQLAFHWAPPNTSSNHLYQEHSHFKAHVELLGPTDLWLPRGFVLVYTACCRIPNMVFAPIRQRKPMSCWRGVHSGSWQTRPISKGLSASDPITRQ